MKIYKRIEGSVENILDSFYIFENNGSNFAICKWKDEYLQFINYYEKEINDVKDQKHFESKIIENLNLDNFKNILIKDEITIEFLL